MNNKKTIYISLLIVILLLSSCKREKVFYDNRVIFSNDDTLMIVNQKGRLIVRNDNSEFWEYENIKSIRSIDALDDYIYALTNKGEVINLSFGENKKMPDTSEWENIEIISVSTFGVFGLMKDGGTLFSPVQDTQMNLEFINNNIKNWPKMKYIDFSSGVIVGVTLDGNVKAIGIGGSSFEEETETWVNIERVSLSDDTIVGIDSSGQVFLACTSPISKFDQNINNILFGAYEICIGDWIIMGLMPEGEIKVVYGNTYDRNDKHKFNEVECLENAVDIYNVGKDFVILLDDGNIIKISEE